MLNKEDFFTKFTSVCPGSLAISSNQSNADLDVYFEPLSISGLKEMHRYSIDPRLYEFFEFDPFETIEDTKAYIEKLQQRMAVEKLNRTSMYWFVRRKVDGRLVGSAGLTSLNYNRQSIEWGYGVDPELWGLGYILQIEEILKNFVFDILQLNRLYGTTMITNERTIGSLQASGMKHEGILRQFYCKRNIFIDGWQYAMLKEDYFTSKPPADPASQQHTIEDVIGIISSVLTEEEINYESTMCNTLSWDSLNHMSIMVAVSQKTGVKITPSEMTRANSVKAVYDILMENFRSK
jgi:RimJ/RimL family protein N-acetyltransferase/acyl carrier protein